MKSNSISEFRKLSEDELRQELKKLQEVQFKLRFQQQVDENNDTTQARKSKRKIAQIKTLLHQRKISLSKQSPTPASQAVENKDQSEKN